MANQLEERASYGHRVKDLTEDQQARSVVVSKIPRVIWKSSLMQELMVGHFEWVRNGGGKIECIQFPNEGTAIITFESREVVKRVMDLPHVFGGTELKVCGYSAEAFYEFKLLSSKTKVDGRKGRKDEDEPQPAPGIPRKALLKKSLSDQDREKQVQNGVADTLSEAETLADELARLRQMLANEVQFREKKEQELMEMEVVVFELLEEQTRIVNAQQEERLNSDLAQMRSTLHEKERTIAEMQRTLKEERQARLAVNEEEEKLRNDLDQMRKTLDVRERTIVKLQNAVDEEQQAKTATSEELSQARTSLSELEKTVEKERLQKTIFEERMEEERSSHLSTEMELLSAVSEADQQLQEENRQKTALEERITSLEHEKEEVLAESRDWIIPREEVVLGERVLGKGAWGEVREGTFRGCQVAVKNVHELIISDYNRRLFEREISIASRCRHPNLLQLIGATNEKGSSPLLVTELLDTSLREVLHDRALNQSEIFGLSLDVAKGLNYLHLHKPHPIIHRDISSANVLLWRRDDCWRAKLSDYGSANFLRQSQTKSPGSPIYSAPESSETSQHSPKMDVYSFGVLLCEMCTREQPDPLELHKQIGRVNGDLKKLIQRCVKESPQTRPDINEVLSRLEEICKSKGSVWRRLLKL